MPDPDANESPAAVISDPRALRALAHAGRAKILERLTVYGPATATECAEEVGMSPSACSYHLRLLERYGFVAEAHDDERTDGRERLWRAVVTSWRSETSDDTDPQTMQSIDMALARVFRVREGQSVEFRAEAYNILNSFRPGDIDTNLSSAQFGKIRNALDPRILQFALKYAF